MGGAGQQGADQQGADQQGADQEVEELKFLVGTACSRAINLLMQPDPDRVALREEMSFLGAKASRLAELLATPPAEGGSPS